MSSLKKFSATASSTFKPSSAKAARQTSETPVQSATTANTTKSRLRANVSPSSASSQSTKDLTTSPSQSRLPRQNLKSGPSAKGKTTTTAKKGNTPPVNEQTQQEQVQPVQHETKLVEISVERSAPSEKEVNSPQVEVASATSRNTTRRESLEPDSAKKSKFGSSIKSVVTKFTSANRLMSAASSRRQSAAQPEPLSARTRNTVAVSPKPAESDGDMTQIEDKEFEKFEQIAHGEDSHDYSHSEARQTYHNDNIRRGSERPSTDAFNSRNHDRDESLTKSQFFPKKETPQAQGDVDQSHLSSSSEEETELEPEQSQGRHSNRSEEGRSFIDDAANVEMATGPISGRLVKDPTVPRFAFELSHQKMYDIKSFERKLSQDPREALSRMGSPRGKEYVSVKAFYHDILKELEQTPLNIEDDSQISFLINKAHRIDQVTFSVVQEKLGPQYSQGLYRIFKKYADNCRSNDQDFMNYTRFLTFAKDFRLFSQGSAGAATSRANVGMIFSKRCPTKLIDFAAFVDLLYKMSKDFNASEQGSNRNGSFQAYLDRFVLSQHTNILERQQSPRGRIQAFGREYVAENKALRILEGHDELIKHVFTLYKSLDIKYSSKSVVQLKDFKNFCTEFCLVPVLVSLNEVHEIFRRFQLGSKPVVDFRGFILAICCIANIGFEKEAFKNKFGDFTKRISKMFELLADMNSKIAPQLLDKDIKRCKF